MPPHDHHHGGHHGGGHGGGHPFSNWGWGREYVPIQVIETEEPETPTWVWIMGGALVGMILAGMGRH